METKIWDDIVVHGDGGISNGDARQVRKRLRVLVTADMRELALIVEQLQIMQNRLANLASMEFAVEDLAEPKQDI